MTQTGTTFTTYQPIPDMLTSVTDVRRAVAQVQRAADELDYERAAGYERAMHEAVLEAVASGNAQAGYLAAAALESRDIDFPRGA
jgi:molybdate-binding protein